MVLVLLMTLGLVGSHHAQHQQYQQEYQFGVGAFHAAMSFEIVPFN